MEGAESSTPRRSPERRFCPDQTRRGQEQTERRTKERSGTCPNAIQLSLRHCQVSREAAGTCRHPTAHRKSQSHLRLATEKAGMGRGIQTGHGRGWGKLSADETNLLSPSPGISNVALPRQPPPRHVWHSVKAAGAPCLRPPGQEDRLQDLVTSTPDLWHHLPPHFSIPPPMVPVALSCAQPLGSLLQPDLNGARWDFCSFLPQLPQSLLPWLRESCQRFALPSFHSTKPIAHRPAEFLIMESSQSNGSPLCPTAHPPSDAALARAGSCATPSSSSPKLPGRRGP